LLGKPAVIAFAQALVQVVLDELAGIPNYEVITERIIRRIGNTLNAPLAQTVVAAISHDA
jgi:hypothetical protein